MSQPARDQTCERATRPWRITLVLYGLVLTLGTHWPRLELRLGDIPAPDKILHLLGFGGLAFLLWRSRLWRLGKGGWPLAVVALLWTVLDEVTQAIPILGRSFSWMDVAGGWMGVTLVLTWIWAIKPIGGPEALRRYQQRENVIDALFLRASTWIIMALAGLAGSAVLGVPLAMYAAAIDQRTALAAFAAGGILSGSACAVITLLVLCRRLENHENNDNASEPPAKSKPDPKRALWHGIATFIGVMSLLTALYMLAYTHGLHWPWAMVLMQTGEAPAASRVPPDLRLAIDLTLLGLSLAVSFRIYRETLARSVDTHDP